MSYSGEAAPLSVHCVADHTQEFEPPHVPAVTGSKIADEAPVLAPADEPEVAAAFVPSGMPQVERSAANRRGKFVRTAAVLAGACCLAASGCTAAGIDTSRTVTVNPADALAPYAKKLPSGITQQIIDATLRDSRFQTVETYKGGVLQSRTTSEYYGSGVFINYDGTITAVTAAHVGAHSGSHCKSVTAYAQTGAEGKTNAYHVVKQAPYAALPPGDILSDTYNGGNDIEVQLLGKDKPFTSVALPESALPSSRIEIPPGNVVFAINNEPDSHGNQRYPGDSTPAIYPMVVIGDSGNDYVAIDGLGRSYGSGGNVETEGGASGGGNYLDNGTFVGVTSRGHVVENEKYILDTFNIAVPKGTYYLEYIAPITAGLFQSYFTEATRNDECTTLPVQKINK